MSHGNCMPMVNNRTMRQMFHMMNEGEASKFNAHWAKQEGFSNYSPRVDIVEEESNYRLVTDLPGMTKDDINISLEKDVLTISGERPVQEKSDKEKMYLNERSFGKFTRSFNLNKSIKSDKINASFDNGVLTMILPKQDEEKPKKIKISTN